MTNWLTSKNRKVHQRELNKAIRKVNKAVEKDPLWKGRFYIRQLSADFCIYKDESGGTLYATIAFYDKMTDNVYIVTDTANSFRFMNGLKLSVLMNEFITEKVKVWEEK